MKFLFSFLLLNLFCMNQSGPRKLTNYDQLVLSDKPVAYWNDASGLDATAARRQGNLKNGSNTALMPNGSEAIGFNGKDQYLEVTTDPAFSVPATHVLTIEAWMRPDTLDFAFTEGSGYVYWLGKGRQGEQEYAARIYGRHPSGHDQDRANRISGYVFNPEGGLGAGSYYQAPSEWPVRPGEWLHYVLIINTSQASATPKYPTGYTKLYLVRMDNQNQLKVHKDQDALISYQIVPRAGSAPFRAGTRDLSSFFQGAVGKIAFYNYELNEDKILSHSRKMFQLK